MITLFGRVLGKQNRLRLAYEQEWRTWWRAGPVGTFPTFEQWLTARTEQAEQAGKEAGDVRS